jgi:UDP-N-acetylglucosamine pyrophosphorylase
MVIKIEKFNKKVLTALGCLEFFVLIFLYEIDIKDTMVLPNTIYLLVDRCYIVSPLKRFNKTLLSVVEPFITRCRISSFFEEHKKLKGGNYGR